MYKLQFFTFINIIIKIIKTSMAYTSSEAETWIDLLSRSISGSSAPNAGNA